MAKVHPHLWFDDQAHDAATFYVDLIPNSSITNVVAAPPGVPGGMEPGAVFFVDFVLDGVPFTGLNGGPHLKLDDAYSMYLDCDGQDEVDRYWAALTADGGRETQCGWCVDRFGVSWQVVPRQMGAIMSGPDPEGAARAMQAMLGMVKLDIAGLQAAYDGD